MIPKLLYTFKQSIDKYNIEDKYSYDFIIKFIIDSAFGETSDFYKEGIKKELFNNFDYGTNIVDNYLLIELAAESKNPKKIIPLIKKYFDELKLTEEDLERYKRVRISREVKKFDYVITGVSTLKNDILDYGDILYNKIDLIKNISLKQVNKVKKEIDFDNVSVVVGNIKSK